MRGAHAEEPFVQSYFSWMVTGDLAIDAHHTTEDVAICLGQAIRHALGNHRGIRRMADVATPMDEALAHVAVDCGGRGYFVQRDRFVGGAVLCEASFVVLGDTEDERLAAKQAVKQQIAFYASTRTYEPVLATHGWQDLVPHLHKKSVEGDWKGMADLITDEMIDTYAVTGTYEDIGKKIRERYTGLLDRTGLYQPEQPGLDDPRLPRRVQDRPALCRQRDWCRRHLPKAGGRREGGADLSRHSRAERLGEGALRTLQHEARFRDGADV